MHIKPKMLFLLQNLKQCGFKRNISKIFNYSSFQIVRKKYYCKEYNITSNVIDKNEQMYAFCFTSIFII